MDFNNMLVMVGPSGVECPYSIKDVDSGGNERIPNNHWCVSSSGVYVARGANYLKETDIAGGTIPRLLTIKNGKVVELIITEDLLRSDYTVIPTDIVASMITAS